MLNNILISRSKWELTENLLVASNKAIISKDLSDSSDFLIFHMNIKLVKIETTKLKVEIYDKIHFAF